MTEEELAAAKIDTARASEIKTGATLSETEATTLNAAANKLDEASEGGADGDNKLKLPGKGLKKAGQVGVKGLGKLGAAVSKKAAAKTAATAVGKGVLGTGISGAAVGAGVAALAGVAAVAAVVAVSIYAIVKAYNKEADALKKA
jgi:hypothetical protein